MTEKIQLTKEGKAKLEKELRDLIDNQRPQNIQELVEAKAQGDLSENADYDAARARQAEIEHRINEIEYILSHHVLIKEAGKNSNKIGLGSVVTIRRLDNGNTNTYSITGSTEADPFANKISNSSPLGLALIGHSKGETITVKAKKGDYEVEILDINAKI